MNAHKIIDNIETLQIQGDLEKEITNMSYDSRAIKPMGLFVAIRGFKIDGHDFIEKAISNGATVIIAEEVVGGLPVGITFIQVKDSRIALSKVSANFFEKPTTHLKLIAITGTNGKTSISYILSQMLQYLGLKVGIIGTSGVKINGDILKNVTKTTPTTPESLDIQTIAHLMLNQGVEIIVMEASSMALKLNRLLDCDINMTLLHGSSA
jgi:UDP-N-acetylmuramoyl-L-alanyl-D-glutamate--2,6-diaminopimelate ligase